MKTMRYMFYKITVLSLAFVIIAVSTSRADIQIITTAEGIAEIKGGNIAGAKENAKKDALRQALEQGVGMLMDAES
ncbi:MAG: hypothetical protein HOJ48_04205, partial [Desulfobacula sp.]|nr:hypothetical protein [Desulfobacula sp.]